MEEILRLKALSSAPLDVQLQFLGLSKDWLLKVSESLALIPMEITEDDVVGALGLKAYMQAVRTLREVLKPHGWQTYRDCQLELVLSPSQTFCIAVSSGDQFTGLKIGTPKTKYPKGPLTQKRVFSNKQIELFPHLVEKKEISKIPTWFFLYFIDLSSQEVRTELSYPLGTDEQGRISNWEVRIILPPVFIDSEIKVDLDVAEAEGIEEMILGEKNV